MTHPDSPDDWSDSAFYRVVRYFLDTPLSRAGTDGRGAAADDDGTEDAPGRE